MWWWQAAQWNTDRYIIPRGRMHEPALDYHKPAKRGGKRERGGADSVDRGQVGFVPLLIEFQDLLMLLRQQSKSLNTLERVFEPCHQRQLWLCSYRAAEEVPKSPALFPLPNLILPRPHVEQKVWGSSTVRDTRNDSSEKLKMQWDSFP